MPQGECPRLVNNYLKICWRRDYVARPQRMRVSVRCVVERPGVRGGTFVELAVWSRMIAVPLSLICCPISYSSCAGSRTRCNRAGAYARGAVETGGIGPKCLIGNENAAAVLRHR